MRQAVIAFAAIAAACDGSSTVQSQIPNPPEADAPRVSAVADRACEAIFAQLSGFVRETDWSIVTRNLLLESDAELWAQYRDDELCPGVAEVDLDGDGANELAITEVRRVGDHLEQRLSVYRPILQTTERVWRADDVPFAYVVFATAEREATDFYSGQTTRFPDGAFVLERMEAWAVVYFEIEGELRSVLVSD